jgi:hypothetical protein
MSAAQLATPRQLPVRGGRAGIGHVWSTITHFEPRGRIHFESKGRNDVRLKAVILPQFWHSS